MFKISKITYIALIDWNRYIATPENSLELAVLCKTHETSIIQRLIIRLRRLQVNHTNNNAQDII